MEHVGKTLSGLVVVYDVMFADITFSSYSAFHGTAHVWTAGCHGAHSFSHFLYEYLLFVIYTMASYKPGFIMVQYTSQSELPNSW